MNALQCLVATDEQLRTQYIPQELINVDRDGHHLWITRAFALRDQYYYRIFVFSRERYNGKNFRTEFGGPDTVLSRTSHFIKYYSQGYTADIIVAKYDNDDNHIHLGLNDPLVLYMLNRRKYRNCMSEQMISDAILQDI